MGFIVILQVILLGIIEGITEWLPISSTGHMLLFDSFWPLKNVTEDFKSMFFVVIQLGAILAVVVLFWKKLFPFRFKEKPVVQKDIFSLWGKVLVACLPNHRDSLGRRSRKISAYPACNLSHADYLRYRFYPRGKSQQKTRISDSDHTRDRL